MHSRKFAQQHPQHVLVDLSSAIPHNEENKVSLLVQDSDL